MKYVLAFGALLLAHGAVHTANAASFTLVEQTQVRNDRAEVGLLSETMHPSQAAAEQASDRLINWVYSQRSQYPTIHISVMRRRPTLHCQEDCFEKEWVSRVNVTLRSKDFDRIKDIASSLSQDFTLNDIRFNLSPFKRTLTENSLILKAEQRFIGESPNGSDYDSMQIDLQNTQVDAAEIKQQMSGRSLNPGYSIIRVTLSQF